MGDCGQMKNGFGSPLMTKREARMHQAAHLYYTEHKSMRSIAKQMGTHRTQVERYLKRFKKENLNVLARDFRSHNKRLLEKMVELLIESEHRKRKLWDLYLQIEDEYYVLYKKVINCRELIFDDKLAQIVDDRMLDLQLKITSKKERLLNSLRKESQFVVSLFWKFGLTGADATKVIMTDGIDIEQTIEQVKDYLVQMNYIIAQEVENPEERNRIISKIQKNVDTVTFLKEDEEEFQEVHY